MIYLYIKQHSLTGLKYFGKTTRKNPFSYLGSGIKWSNHIKKHGKEYVQTLDVFGFDNQELCTEFALRFSKDNNIVKEKNNGKKTWANLIDENGLDGCPHGYKHSNKAKIKMSNTKLGRIFSAEHKTNLSKSRIGKKHSDNTKTKMSRSKSNVLIETRQKMSDSAKGKHYSKETREKLSNAIRGLKREIITCPHCNKSGGINAMKRYHLNNCKALKR